MSRRNALLVLPLALLAAVAPASAGLWQDVYDGLVLVTTPPGQSVSSVGDGTRVSGNRIGRVALVPNQLGQGWRVEVDRTFAVDPRGRPEVLDLGAVELELEGNVSATAGYTRRWFTTGSLESATNLNYVARFKSGAEDAQLAGTLTGGSNFEVNQFGFYNLSVSFSNQNSQLVTDGLAVELNDDTDWDIGPIVVRGNIFYDGFLAVLTALGVDTTKLEQIFPESPINTINDAIAANLLAQGEALGLVAGDGTVADEAALLAIAPLGDNTFDVYASDSLLIGPAIDTSASQQVPEPASVLLFGGLLIAAAGRRRL